MRAYQRFSSSRLGASRAIVAAASDGEAPKAVRTPGSAIPPLLQKGVSPGPGGSLPETKSHLTASDRIRGPAALDAFSGGNSLGGPGERSVPQTLIARSVETAESADRKTFEAALAADAAAPRKKLLEGQVVNGIIAGITPDIVLVSIGGKSEALMDLKELEGEKVGDRIEA